MCTVKVDIELVLVLNPPTSEYSRRITVSLNKQTHPSLSAHLNHVVKHRDFTF